MIEDHLSAEGIIPVALTDLEHVDVLPLDIVADGDMETNEEDEIMFYDSDWTSTVYNAVDLLESVA